LPAPKLPPMITVNFGTVAVETAVTIFRAVLRDAFGLVLLADHEAVMFCRNTSGILRGSTAR